MARQIITFDLGGQKFGMDIMAIREIRAWTPTTRLPQAQEYVVGVVNLRGTVLPVLDLSARMGWERTEPTDRHVIMVAEIAGRMCGLIVDAVSDIVTTEDGDIQPSPTTGTADTVPFLEGVVAHDDFMVMIIDQFALSGDIPLTEAA